MRHKLIPTQIQDLGSSYHVPEDDQNEVGVDVSLVNLVDDHVRDPSETGLQFPQQHSCRGAVTGQNNTQ